MWAIVHSMCATHSPCGVGFRLWHMTIELCWWECVDLVPRKPTGTRGVCIVWLSKLWGTWESRLIAIGVLVLACNRLVGVTPV